MNDKTSIVVIPCYNVERHITQTIHSIPDFVTKIIAVNDCSQDNTANILEQLSTEIEKLIIINHSENQGVGASMISGFNEALKYNCDVIVKVDGDGQMDLSYLKKMIDNISDDVDMTKGNRFFDRESISKMPSIRRVGNVGMGFLVKISSGYWNIFDPTNGFFCIKTSSLKLINFGRLSKRFFFESSLLMELYYAGVRIKDIPVPTIYADEKSNLSILKALFGFPPRLLKGLIRRIVLRYFVYDFNINSLYILFGYPLFLFGLIFGAINWIHYASINIPAPTGTIMLALLTLVLGFQMILASIQYDMSAKNPFDRNE